jgi:hypothetical protein
MDSLGHHIARCRVAGIETILR